MDGDVVVGTRISTITPFKILPLYVHTTLSKDFISTPIAPCLQTLVKDSLQ